MELFTRIAKQTIEPCLFLLFVSRAQRRAVNSDKSGHRSVFCLENLLCRSESGAGFVEAIPHWVLRVSRRPSLIRKGSLHQRLVRMRIYTLAGCSQGQNQNKRQKAVHSHQFIVSRFGCCLRFLTFGRGPPNYGFLN